MPEENADVKAVGNPYDNLPSESSPDTQESVDPVEEQKENPQEETKLEENKIPHSRVKEMQDKAYEKGKQEAIDQLLAEQKDKEVTPSEEVTEPDYGTDDVKAAEALVRKAVKAEIAPYMVRQEVEGFLKDTPDALNHIDKIKELKSGNKDLSWDQAYKLATYDDKIKGAEQVGVAKAEAGIAAKESAQTEKPAAMKQEQPQSMTEKISDRSIPLAEIEKQIMNNLTQ